MASKMPGLSLGAAAHSPASCDLNVSPGSKRIASPTAVIRASMTGLNRLPLRRASFHGIQPDLKLSRLGAASLAQETALSSTSTDRRLRHAASSATLASSLESVKVACQITMAWEWHNFPLYSMPRKTLEDFLKGKFGNFNFYIDVGKVKL